jgi:hypothetical protein
MRKHYALAVLALSAITAQASAAVTLAEWTFETSLPLLSNSQNIGGIVAEGGVFGGTASGSHASANTDYSNPVGNGTFESFSSNEWTAGDYYQFETSSLGYESITIEWQQGSSNTGPLTFDLEYSTNGTTWNTLMDDYTVAITGSNGPGIWSSGTFLNGYGHGPAAGPAALDNAATIYFRLTNQASPALTGTNRIDNVIVSGTLIPEPASFGLLAVGALAMLRRARKA